MPSPRSLNTPGPCQHGSKSQSRWKREQSPRERGSPASKAECPAVQLPDRAPAGPLARFWSPSSGLSSESILGHQRSPESQRPSPVLSEALLTNPGLRCGRWAPSGMAGPSALTCRKGPGLRQVQQHQHQGAEPHQRSPTPWRGPVQTPAQWAVGRKDTSRKQLRRRQLGPPKNRPPAGRFCPRAPGIRHPRYSSW